MVRAHTRGISRVLFVTDLISRRAPQASWISSRFLRIQSISGLVNLTPLKSSRFLKTPRISSLSQKDLRRWSEPHLDHILEGDVSRCRKEDLLCPRRALAEATLAEAAVSSGYHRKAPDSLCGKRQSLEMSVQFQKYVNL
jgi:hypothetical protein